jgi:hypothetical protein
MVLITPRLQGHQRSQALAVRPLHAQKLHRAQASLWLDTLVTAPKHSDPVLPCAPAWCGHTVGVMLALSRNTFVGS